MEILYQIGIIIILSVISGIFGRLGGRDKDGSWYDFISKSWVRDWLCPLIALLALWLIIPFRSSLWRAYLITYLLTAGSLATYWDWLFGDKDNLWFAGWMSGLAFLPLMFAGVHLYALLPRAFLLAAIWGGLNKWLPSKVLLWRRDIAGEFLRYFTLPITLLILLMR